MSSLRSLVTGSDVCAPQPGNQNGNVVSSLANMFLDRTRGNSRTRQDGPSSSSIQNFFENALPPEERQMLMTDAAQTPDNALANGKAKRVDAQLPPVHPDIVSNLSLHPPPQSSENAAIDPTTTTEPYLHPPETETGIELQRSFAREFHEYQRIFDEASSSQTTAHSSERDYAVSGVLKRFLDYARSDVPFSVESIPAHLTFDQLEKEKIQSRVQHLCHVVFAEHGPQFAEEQAMRLLQSFGIVPVMASHQILHQAWNDAMPLQKQAPIMFQGRRHNLSQEFSQLLLHTQPPMFNSGLTGFNRQQIPEPVKMSQPDAAEAKDISSALIKQMINDTDPRFRNSKFLKFVQKLESGELVIEGDQVKEGTPANPTASSATNEAITQADHPWVEEFERQMLRDPVRWGQEAGSLEGGWLDENEMQEWIENYQQMAYGSIEEDKEYQFSEANPFMGNPNALEIAWDLFSKGNLTEAAAAAESVVHREENNIEAWILIGRIHAENDNDIQAIAAFNRAHGIDPSNLEVLLNLAVSHANELHEQKTVSALTAWLQQHPQYRSHLQAQSKPQDPSQGLSHTMRVFHQILADHASDADVLVALGVLHHLGRNFEEAISLFQSATRLRPDDYTLWNKLGATQANAARSGEAIDSYNHCLEQKPNYMRGWANLGISYANVGDYVSSVKHYVQALALNNTSETVWGYLKSSAICAGFTDLLTVIDHRDLDALIQRFPR